MENGNPDLLADYLSKTDLARQFDVSVRTIERWVRLRILPKPLRLGRKSLFHMAEVKEHLARQHRHGGADRPRRRRGGSR